LSISIEQIAIYGSILGGLAVIYGILRWIANRRKKRRDELTQEEDRERMTRIEGQVKITSEKMTIIEKRLGAGPIYIDDLPSADPPVFDPFLEGTKLMTAYKWDEAIAEFTKAMKEAKASQLVALYNLVATCYYTSGRLGLALENYEESLRLARQFGDKQGEGNALGNIGLIYQDKGNLDQALKYLEEALKIHKEIGFKEGEASDLGNIGLIYRTKGDLDEALRYHQDALKIHKEIGFKQGEASALGNIGLIFKAKGELDQALKYLEDALKIHKEIGFREGEASDLNNIGNVYEDKGNLDQALKYYNEALKIFEEIGMPEQIGIVKRNIERIKKK
jgi:tetratricopeptide (TPR) repeat protein